MSLRRRRANPATSALREGRAALAVLNGWPVASAATAGVAQPAARNRIPELRRVLDGPREAGAPIEKAASLVSEIYLEGVRAMECAFCGKKGPSSAHHVLVRGRRRERNDLMAVPACGSGSMGCHGAAHNARLPWERQFLAVAETQAELFRKQGRTWWRAVTVELAAGIGG